MSPRPRNEHSRTAILDAVLHLVEDVGYDRLTIEGIAARAGVGKTTIYRWWPSKDAVLLDAYLALQARSGGTDLPDTGDLRADLRALLTGVIAGMADRRFDAPYRALTAAMQHDPVLAEEVLDRLLGPLLTLTRARLERSQERGELRADVDLDLAVELLYGPVFHRWLLRTRPLAEADGTLLADLVHRAVTGP